MKYKHSLRIRITVTFFLFGTLLMVAVAFGVNYAMENIEDRVYKENLHKELHNFKQRYRADPQQPLPHSASMNAYLVGPGEESRLPDYMRSLAPGTYEIKHNGRFLQIIVAQVNGKKMALELDATIFEHRETKVSNALIVVVISASVLALWLGYMLSQKAIAPVTSLARTVAVLEPNVPADKLAPQYVNDEVGELAFAFDRYLDRLQDFVAREQEFTGNASHELRTPLTIIKGAVELLNNDPKLSSRSRNVLQRIKRAADNMSQMVDTLLVLAREDELTDEDVIKVSAIANEAIAENNALLRNKTVMLEINSKQDFGLQVPRSILTILLGNLLRNAIAYTKEGNITITIDAPFVLVTDTGEGITTEALPLIFDRHYRGNDNDSSGSGIGLSIVKRICDHYKWQIDVNSTLGKGTVVSIDFSNSVEKTG
ncbi:sensor histidine kinase [Kaarinaea lacus]